MGSLPTALQDAQGDEDALKLKQKMEHHIAQGLENGSLSGSLSTAEASLKKSEGTDESEEHCSSGSDHGLPLLGSVFPSGVAQTKENGKGKPQLPKIDLAVANSDVDEPCFGNSDHGSVAANGVQTNKEFEVHALPAQPVSFLPCPLATENGGSLQCADTTSPSTTPVRDQSPHTSDSQVEGTPVKTPAAKKALDSPTPDSQHKDAGKTPVDAPWPVTESAQDETNGDVAPTLPAATTRISNGSLSGSMKVASLKLPSAAIQQRAADGCTLFGVEVTAHGDQQQWTVLKRYNDFCSLRDGLGRGVLAMIDAPFPRKHVRSVTGARLEERRAQLERWLQRIVDVSESSPTWSSHLQVFFETDRENLV
jgi:hypothetical protein